MAKRDKHAYILILPSMFTTGNIFFGFYSIIRSFNQDFEKAAYAIFIAGIFDVLDGRIARITRSTSDFGVEYDSIADVVSFGIAPAILAYVWLLQDFGRLGWVGAFFFVACGSLRLARFNSMAGSEISKSYFMGLPIPAAANMIAATAIANSELQLPYIESFVLAFIFLLGLLMVSSIRYRAFKDIDVRHRRRFFQLVLFVILVAAVAIRHEITLFVVIGSYVLFAPARELFVLLRRKKPSAKKGTSSVSQKSLV